MRVEKAAELIGKITARMKTIRGLVMWCYCRNKTNVNIKLKIAS